MALAKKLIVHIGQPKTGTTSLQASLKKSRELLLRHGVCYPYCREAINHTQASHYLTDRLFMPRLLLRRFDGDTDAVLEHSRAFWDATLLEIANSKAETVILSTETIYDFGKRGAIAPFLDKITSIAEEIDVVCYVREPASLYLSLKQQNLKYARSDPAPRANTGMREALEPIMNDSRVRLNLHKFHRNDLAEGDVITDFAQRYLPEPLHSQLSRADDDLNISISAEMMLICEDLIAKSDHPKLADHIDFPISLSAALPRIDRAFHGFRPARLRPGLANVIHAQSEDLLWLKENFDIQFDPPNDDPIDPSIDPASLRSTRDLCNVDEDRYRRLLDAFPSEAKLKADAKRQKRMRWIRNTPARMRRNSLRALNYIGVRLG